MEGFSMSKKGGIGYCSICECIVNNASFHRAHYHKSPLHGVDRKSKPKSKVSQKKTIRKECKHQPWMVKAEYHADTGNYDPSCDSFWTNCHCLSCGKKWVEDGQDRKNYSSKREWEAHMKYLDRVAKGQKKIEKEFGMTRSSEKETAFFHKNHTDW